MSSLVVGPVVIGRRHCVELFSRNLPADGARDDQSARIDGGGRRATVVIPRLEKRTWRFGLGAKGRTPVWNHDCRWVLLRAAPAKRSAKTFSCFPGTGIIEPETPLAKNSDHFAKPWTDVPNANGPRGAAIIRCKA